VPPPPSPRRRRRWGFIAVAVVAVLGLAIGLLVAQPWEPPPLLAPLGVQAATTSTTAGEVSWQQAPGSRKPGDWVVVRNGAPYAVVPGTQLHYTDSKLLPGGTYAYRIYERSGTAKSPGSELASVKTAAPSVQNLRQVGENWTTVTLRWDPPSGAPRPDEYSIVDSSGRGVGEVNGNVTTYTVTGIQVASAPGAYSVSAVWDGNQSDSSPSVNAVTRQPPLNSDYAMSYDNTSSPGGTMTVGTHWTDDWTFSPSCSGNACKEGLQASFDPPATAATPFTVTLKPSGGHYVGTTHDEIFACSTSTSTAPFLQGGSTNDTVNVDITPVHTSGGVWTSFTGTVLVTMPYTIASNPLGVTPIGVTEYCPTQSWTFSVSGHPSSS
jgi:hypothetical protein